MADRWTEAISSINTFVKDLKPKKAKVKLIAFDKYGEGLSYEVLRDTTAKDWTNVLTSEVSPRGTTPLYDAAGKMFAEAEANPDDKTVFVIMTDGYENASTEFRYTQIKAAVKRMTEERKWPVTFLGANFDDVETVSASVGVSAGSTVNLASGHMMRGMSITSAKVSTYFDSSGEAAMNAMQYTADEKELLSGKKKKAADLAA